VWGEGSKNYSEEVVKSYICKHGTIIMEKNNRQLSLNSLAAIHVGGSENLRANVMFGRKVRQLAIMGKFSLYFCCYITI